MKFLSLYLYSYNTIEAKTPRRVDVLQIIKEDGHFLYGFADKDEKEWFARLTKVSGVGAEFKGNFLRENFVNLYSF